MQSEKVTCVKKIQEIFDSFLGKDACVEIHSEKETSCSTPQIKSLVFRQGERFLIIRGYSMEVTTNPTPKLVKKIKVTGTVGGVEVSKVFSYGDLDADDFFNGLVNAKKEEFEEPEA